MTILNVLINIKNNQYKKYKKLQCLKITSDYILDELYTRILYDFGPRFVEIVIDKMQKLQNAQQLQVIHIDERCFQKSIAVFQKFKEHTLSLTDASVYVLMKEFSFDEVFTLDKDFKKIGLQTSF